MPIAGHEVGVSSIAVPVAVRVCGRELHAGRVDWPLGTRTFSRVQMEREAVDLPWGHAGICKAARSLRGHVEVRGQADGVEGDGVAIFLLRDPVVEDLQEEDGARGHMAAGT